MDVRKCQCGCDESIKERNLGSIDKIKPPVKKKLKEKNMFIQTKTKSKSKKKIKSNY